MASPWKKLPISLTICKKFLNCKQAQQKVKKKRKEEKGKGAKEVKKSKSLKTQVAFSCGNFDFCVCLCQNVVKRDASGKKGKLSCYKCLYDQIKDNLANIQHENMQNVQEIHFWQKAPGVNVLTCDPVFQEMGPFVINWEIYPKLAQKYQEFCKIQILGVFFVKGCNYYEVLFFNFFLDYRTYILDCLWKESFVVYWIH